MHGARALAPLSLVPLAAWLAACASAPLSAPSTPAMDGRAQVAPAPTPWYRIQVVDEATGRGIPAVELRTTDSRLFFTDSAGVVAFGEPDLFGRSVQLGVRSFGYRFAGVIHGEPAALLVPQPGGAAVLRMQRDNVAERLYRLTGSGIYRDSELLGEPVPDLGRLAPGELAPTGMDSAQTESYRGKLFWTWGDTTLSSTRFGNFRTTAATSELPGQGGLDPKLGVRFTYLTSDGHLRAMIDDPHPVVWLSALRSTRDASGAEHLFATYRKVVPPLTIVELGLAEFDDAAGVFKLVTSYGRDEPRAADGHAVHDGEHVYYQIGVRSPADAAGMRDLGRYEAFTALAPGARADERVPALERDATGRLVWAWKAGTAPISRSTWEALERSGRVAPDEAWYRLVDVETGAPVALNGGSLAWSPHRRRWIRIETEIGGRASFLGEVWYFEADTPAGPWAYGRRIATHRMSAAPGSAASDEPDTYSFYNPAQHPELAGENGRELYFEGTLSALFTRRASNLPGYDYNQMMYRLDLDDPRLALPIAIYRTGADGRLRSAPDAEPGAARRLAFFAPDRAGAGRIAVRETQDPATSVVRLVAGSDDGPDVRFWCAPANAPAPPATAPLYEVSEPDGRYTYTSDATELAPDVRARASVVCHVWPRLVRFDPYARTD